VAAGVLALLTMAEVVLSPLWASVFVGEQPTRLALVGGAIVIAAVLAQTLETGRRPAA
jgi:drug/metabolite transporter (DMT)-like permease